MFDKFAETVTRFISRGWFFTTCVILVAVWFPTYFVFASADTWQLIINTITTIVTFLMVALLENAQRRSADALHRKLDAIADGLSNFMEYMNERQDIDFSREIEELRESLGSEQV
jgi:low affinity Fe/Cu permease